MASLYTFSCCTASFVSPCYAAPSALTAEGLRKNVLPRGSAQLEAAKETRRPVLVLESPCSRNKFSKRSGRQRVLTLRVPPRQATECVHSSRSAFISVGYSELSERLSSSHFCSSSGSSSSSSWCRYSSCETRGNCHLVGMYRFRSNRKYALYHFVPLTGYGIGRQARRSKLSKGSVCRMLPPRSENLDVEFTIRAEIGEEEKSVEKLELTELASRIPETGALSHVEDTISRSPLKTQHLPKRWIIVILCFFSFLLCNMDRVNMSIAILPMSAEFHWNSTTVGLVQSSFFWGYLLTQIAGGIWADSIGGKQVLGFGVIWWSLATMATPIAAKMGLPALLFVRACMGVGEGVAMPAMNNMLSRWVPVSERSRSLALVYSGMYLGSVTGLAFSPSLIHKFNWPSVFFSFGSLGAIWFAAWQRYAYSSPELDPTITPEEQKLILGNSKRREPVEKIPWRELLSKAPVWALIICHFCHNWGTFILLTWMPTYYHQVLGFNLTESGLFSVLPWLTMAISSNVGGWIADTLVSRGMSVTLVRKIMQSIGFLGPAFCLSQLCHITSAPLAVLCMMGSQGADAFSQSGLYSNHQDIGPRYSGVLLGLSNTAGVLAGVLGTAATGYILQHGTWADVFKVAVGLYLFGAVIWNVFSSGEKIFD